MTQRFTEDKQNSKYRNTNIEILRFILMCFIFFGIYWFMATI